MGKIGLESSVFADALDSYGFKWAGGIFHFVVLTAAISCSSSGLYGCTRALYTLSVQGMAPSILQDSVKIRFHAMQLLFLLFGCWIGILCFTLLWEKNLQNLLALSGFSGAIAWISICWSQLNFRRNLERQI